MRHAFGRVPRETIFPNSNSSEIRSLVTLRYLSHIDEESIRSSQSDGPQRDIVFDWLLRTALPPEFCFDGIDYVFSLEESESSIEMLCTFWYLTDGASLRTALKASFWLDGDVVRYTVSIGPTREFSSYDKMWSELYLHWSGDSDRWEWGLHEAGKIGR